jgi:hypothetical protein
MRGFLMAFVQELISEALTDIGEASTDAFGNLIAWLEHESSILSSYEELVTRLQVQLVPEGGWDYQATLLTELYRCRHALCHKIVYVATC